MKSVDSLSPLANELLRRIDFFERVVGAFEVQRVVETHISLLLIGSSLTLKFKKPVDLGFVCYRTLEDRWRCAVNEVLLNRRLSTHVYRGVLPIRSEGRIDPLTDLLPTPILQAQPQMSEVAVVMNTYDEEQLLSSKLHTDSSDIEQCIVAVAHRLATFHQSPGVKAIPSLVPSIAELASTVQDNILELQKAHRPVLSDAESAALAIVSSYTNSVFEHRRVMLEERIRNEHIVDGHGDLRAEHVCFFESDVDCLDCVEFNQSIRTIDVLNDIAFLKMDLDFLGRPDVARAFIEAYAKASMELVPRELLNFYACYRSMVRAKVDALTADSVRNEDPASRSDEAGGLSRRARHLGLAARYALAIDFSWVVAVTGLMGSGKSTFARYLQGITDAQLLQSDHLRGALFPVSGRNEDFGHGKYSDQNRAAVYDLLLQRADAQLRFGQPLILDASWSDETQRQRLAQLARNHHVRLFWVQIELDQERTLERLRMRQQENRSESEGREELFSAQRQSYQAFSPDQGHTLVQISGASDFKHQVAQLLQIMIK